MTTWYLAGQQMTKVANCPKNEWIESYEATVSNNSKIKSKIIIYPKGFQSSNNLTIFLQLTTSSNSNQRFKYDVHANLHNIHWSGYCDIAAESNNYSCQLKYQPQLDKFYDKLQSIAFKWNVALIENTKHQNFVENKQNYSYDYSDEDDYKEQKISSQNVYQSQAQAQRNSVIIPKTFKLSNVSDNSLKWTIPNIKQLLNSCDRIESSIFRLYDCTWKFHLNLIKHVTLFLSLVHKPNHVESIRLLVESSVDSINKPFAGSYKLDKDKGSCLWPPYYIKRYDIKQLDSVSITVKMQYPVVRMNCNQTNGQLLQASTLKIEPQISHVWNIPVSVSTWNMNLGDSIVSKRFNIWLLRCFPKGSVQMPSVFYISLQRLIVPESVYRFDVHVIIQLQQINYVWNENVQFTFKTQWIRFHLPPQVEKRLHTLNELSFKCDITVKNAFNKNGHAIRFDDKDVFIQKNDIDRLKDRIANLETQLQKTRQREDVRNCSKKGNGDLKKWFESLKLTQYFDLFVHNGWDSFEAIQFITKKHLKEMGITKIGHIVLLCNKIQSRSWVKDDNQ